MKHWNITQELFYPRMALLGCNATWPDWSVLSCAPWQGPGSSCSVKRYSTHIFTRWLKGKAVQTVWIYWNTLKIHNSLYQVSQVISLYTLNWAPEVFVKALESRAAAELLRRSRLLLFCWVLYTGTLVLPATGKTSLGITQQPDVTALNVLQ